MTLVTFYSVSAALYLQELLRGKGLGCDVIPVPRALSSSCGYALETQAGDTTALRSLCEANGVEWEAMYRREQDGCYTILCSDNPIEP